MDFHYSYKDDSGTLHGVSTELLDIAVQLKVELQKANGRCNWRQLKRMLIEEGFDNDMVVVCEGFRLLVKNYQDRHYSGNTTILHSLTDTVGKLNQQKRDVQNLSRQFNSMKRTLTDKSLLVEQVHDALVNSTFVLNSSVTPSPKKHTQKALLASFADLHLGAEVDLPTNKYNSKIAKARINDYQGKLIDLAISLDVSDLYIANIGDMVENVYMRFTQGFDTELNFGDQIKYAMQYVGDFVVGLYEALVPYGITIHYTGIAGNHDRINGNKKNNIYGDNVAVVINSFIEFLAEHQLNNDYFDYIEPDSIYRTHLNILGQPIKIVHGDIDNITKDSTFGKIVTYDNHNYRMVLGGHLHRYSVLEVGDKKYMVTSGSFKGSDKYSDSLSKGASLSQAVVLIKANGDLINMNIELADCEVANA